MSFTEYRSKALTGLFNKGFNRDVVCRLENFSTVRVDNICANNWRVDNPIDVCISLLYEYIRDEVI